MRKLFSVTFEEVVSVENLCEAWQEFIRGKRKKKDVQEFILRLGDQIADLHQNLMNGDYAHSDYLYFRINDPKPRDIHKANVRDRLMHHAIHRKLYPFFAKLFVADSFSCQADKGLHRALERFEILARKVSRNNTRTCWILKCDIRKFFASIDHHIMIDILRGRIADSRLHNLLERVIRSFEARPGKGIPLGNLTSQLFANIYMNEFDWFVKHEIQMKYYARYADDFIFMSHDRSELLKRLPRIAAFLSEPLALSLHPKKVFIKTLASGVDFLGWVHFPHHRVLRTKTKIRMNRRVNLCQDSQTIESYLGMLSHGDAYKLSRDLTNLCWLLASK
ncbi:reverse transcriptase/maturase family protein [Patescibacteria group bacterium]|nr:reverse transcriptase/maturase family protein [Patescibacteria group bacterium]MBU1629926.1 reverse transcriptase/maturase family protein [Patescibacteria group bacterium]MBU1907831.1 reverse transcriptase/maturase family protein [Patescibacteria group bacterium]